MSFYKYITQALRQEYAERSETYRKRLVEWRKSPPVMRVDKPTNLARARTLGYVAKQGMIIARVRVPRGKRKRKKPAGGRKQSKSGRFFSRKKSLQLIAEERAASKYSNMEVLNSYWVGEDGNYKYFEVILYDPSHGNFGHMEQHGRVYRGLTSAGVKSRGLRKKGKGSEKSRPSVRKKIRNF
ncbi:MAG: 50S ribosomal protein L15e [Candidatus Micrarchaeia archaeon]